MMAKTHLQLHVFKLDSILDSLYYHHPNNLVKCLLPCFIIGKRQNTFCKYGKSRTKVQLLKWRINLEPQDVLKVQNTVCSSLAEKHLNFIGLFIVFWKDGIWEKEILELLFLWGENCLVF